RAQGARAHPARGALEPEVAINATPLGLKESDPLPLDPARAQRLAAALDLVYSPRGTRWVRALRAAGIPAHDGREMLVQQGVAAFDRFFPGYAAPEEVMRAAVNRALRARGDRGAAPPGGARPLPRPPGVRPRRPRGARGLP